MHFLDILRSLQYFINELGLQGPFKASNLFFVADGTICNFQQLKSSNGDLPPFTPLCNTRIKVLNGMSVIMRVTTRRFEIHSPQMISLTQL